MIRQTLSGRARGFRPTVMSLEGRALLNAAMPKVKHLAVHAEAAKAPKALPSVTVISQVTGNHYAFTNVNANVGAGTAANTGTNINGLANNGTAVGFAIDNSGKVFSNFVANPLNKHAKPHNLNLTNPAAQAFGINKHGTVVGGDGNGNAFGLTFSNKLTTVTTTPATAFGINDKGAVVGQYTAADGTLPGFIRPTAKTFITINSATGPITVNAQGINNKGLVVGFYVGADGNQHGFTAHEILGKNAPAVVTGQPVADPVIPTVAGEPGATFVFSQILGVNDKGIAVGYYGDSTTSQHGFLYNTNTGQYTFLDDPSEAFNNGVEVTQITGINNAGEISGFYSDANGVFHGFVATPTKA